ncbi:glycoside hydrolase family 57 [Thermodesulfatator indicus DSM 15286]|uniref:Glycoside hydrolase family 57 n=1 Tax=Thermodesulfatator indicus (strain DSM 15286 / JCM 11887 / CIR29812) TaxID=667014 RepID=F8A9S5_THEID|nr:1,4-alpha-glucan branching protein domain-containing protein [Thermodesulfatator indicus]AEH45895.1 glycoside hydrolase family 57 [Thermodesulfatator indicus DSM 15286]
MKIEVAQKLVKFTWGDDIHRQVHYPEEDLYLEVFAGNTCVFSRKVNFLNQTEELLAPGDYQARFLRKKRPLLKMLSPFHYTPKVVFVSENERRHHLTITEIDWENIRRDLELGLGHRFGEETSLYLRILRYEDPATNFPEEEWQRADFKDYFLIFGALKGVELHVCEKETQKSLKKVLSLELLPPETISILEETPFSVPEVTGLFLTRQVIEPDQVNLKAYWEFPDKFWKELEKQELSPRKLTWEDTDILLEVFYRPPDDEKWAIFRPEERRHIGVAKDWIINAVPDGHFYQARLVLYDRKKNLRLKEIAASPEFFIPRKREKIVLLPIDERRLFTYWHLDQAELSQKLGRFAAGQNVTAYIKVYHDFFGKLYHHPDKDVAVDLSMADNWYLWVEPDKAYRVQLIAVREDGKVLELTEPSNIAHTARLAPGDAPVSYATHELSIEHPTIRPIESRMGTAEHSIGYLILHLHAHLPYIRRRIVYGAAGIWQPLGFPEEWFHEALVDTYIPLVKVFEDLVNEGVDFKLSMDISPTLTNMMRCPLLQEEFLKYLEGLINLARAEIERVRREAPAFEAAAWMHLRRFEESREIFLRYDKDLTRAFKRFQDLGKLEISTCAATHGFLPFYTMYPEAVRAQIETAVRDYEAVFGRRPIGIWLPECAYVPGIEKYLEEYDLRYFFSETHTVLNGDSPSEFGVHAPVFVRGSKVAVFGRDPETGKQVWSADEGYPGDPDYLDFHIKGGPFRYCRITNRYSLQKEPYNPDWAREKAARHAQHFMEGRNFRFEYIRGWFWKKPLSVATYDAELFGHHWFEGPLFIYFLLKKLYYDQNQTELITPADYLHRYPTNQEILPPPSSWGDKGTFDKWMYGSVSWMYRHIHEAIEALNESAKKAEPREAKLSQILTQAGREVLWAMNSDLGFVISNGHFVDKMKEFFFEALERFWILYDMAEKMLAGKEINERLLREIMFTRPIFPEHFWKVWRKS